MFDIYIVNISNNSAENRKTFRRIPSKGVGETKRVELLGR